MIQRTPTKSTTSERCSAIHFLKWKAKASLKLEEPKPKPTVSQILASDDIPLSKSIEKYRKLFREVVCHHAVQFGEEAGILPHFELEKVQAIDSISPVLFYAAVQLT